MAAAIENLLEYAFRTAGKVEKAAGRSLNYIEIASAYLEFGRQTRCLEILSEAVKTVESLKLPEERVIRLAWMARVYEGAGEEGRARELFMRSRLLARATGGPVQIKALFDIAREYVDAGLNLEASELLVELRGIAANLDNAVDKALELTNIAEIYIDIEQADKAGAILNEAFKLTLTIKDNWFRAERMIEIAGRYASVNSSDKAVEVLKEAAFAVNRNGILNQPYFLLRIVDIYLALGDKAKAAEMLTRTLGIVNQDESVHSKSGDLIEIASKYRQLGDEQRAVSLLAEAREVIIDAESVNDKISGFTRVANELGRSMRTEKATEIANQAFGLCEKVENKRTQIYLIGDLALVFSELKNKAKATEAADKIGRIVKETDVRTLGLGEIASELADSGEYLLALKLAQVIREPDFQATVLTGIACGLIGSDQESGTEINAKVQEIINQD